MMNTKTLKRTSSNDTVASSASSGALVDWLRGLAFYGGRGEGDGKEGVHCDGRENGVSRGVVVRSSYEVMKLGEVMKIVGAHAALYILRRALDESR